MAAPDNLGQQFEQLPMFMSAHELREGTTGAVPAPGDVRNVQRAIGNLPGKSVGRIPLPYERRAMKDMSPTDALWTQKLHAAKERPYAGLKNNAELEARPSLHENLQTSQVETPVRLHVSGINPKADKSFPDKAIQNGHHRIAASYDINPDRLLPVTHTSWNAAGEWSDEHEAAATADDRARNEMAEWKSLKAEHKAWKAKRAGK